MALPRRFTPAVPAPLTMAQALNANQGLVRLNEMVAGSRARLQTVMAAVPRSLQGALMAGPLDESGWTLLVRNAAAAAKLRQLQPHLELLLAERFGAGQTLRVKVLGSAR